MYATFTTVFSIQTLRPSYQATTIQKQQLNVKYKTEREKVLYEFYYSSKSSHIIFYYKFLKKRKKSEKKGMYILTD